MHQRTVNRSSPSRIFLSILWNNAYLSVICIHTFCHVRGSTVWKFCFSNESNQKLLKITKRTNRTSLRTDRNSSKLNESQWLTLVVRQIAIKNHSHSKNQKKKLCKFPRKWNCYINWKIIRIKLHGWDVCSRYAHQLETEKKFYEWIEALLQIRHKCQSARVLTLPLHPPQSMVHICKTKEKNISKLEMVVRHLHEEFLLFLHVFMNQLICLHFHELDI